jgi:Undecaprenyl-phosphate glucose phosphotransferase
MTRRSLNLLQFWLTLVYFSIPLAAFAIAGYVRFVSGYFPAVDVDVYAYTGWLLATTVTWALVLDHQRLNRIETLVTLQTGVKTIAKATLSSLAIVLALSFFYRNVSISRVFVVAGFSLVFAMSVAALHLFRSGIFGPDRQLLGRLKIAVVGADEYAMRLADHLKAKSLIHCDVVCFVALPGQPPPENARAPVLSWEQLESAVDVHGCQEALVALPSARFSELQSITEQVKHLCVPARIVLDIGEGLFVPERVFDFLGLPLLDVRPYPVDTVRYMVGKRIFDLVFSLVALLLLAPVLLAIALLVKLTSRGPVFFAQERVSLNGRRFAMLKFRTMVVQDHASSNHQHTARHDPRITALGRFLRRSSLDELPQFFNVLRGDMSVVGPRPELTFFVQKFRAEIPAYMSRHNVKCGITGWAQINGLRGSDSSIPRRIQYDLYYMKNWSMALDLKIIFLTVFNGLVAKSAY